VCRSQSLYLIAVNSRPNPFLLEFIWISVALIETVFLVAALQIIVPEARALHRLFTLLIVVFPIAYVSTFLTRVLNVLLFKLGRD
jgi:hypothetical protein